MSSPESTDTKTTVTNAVKVAGELLIMPGASQIIDGKLGSGLLHAGAAIVGVAVFGQPLVLLAIANSLSKSINGKSLWSRVKESANRKEPLEDRVRTHLSEGMTMEEIQATLSEDVEDLVMEAQAAFPVTE